MNKFKTFLRRTVIAVTCMMLLLSITAQAVETAPSVQPKPEPDVGQSVFLDSYRLTDEKIVPGGQFTLTLVFRNISSHESSVIVDVFNPTAVIPVYGTITQKIVVVPANDIAEVNFDYNALEMIDSPSVDFQIGIQERKIYSKAFLRASVGTKSPFNIIATSVPSRSIVDENVTCSMTFKLFDSDNINNITARMDVNGQTVETSDVGSIARNATKTQSLFTQFENPGKYVIELFLDYQDSEGNAQSVQVGTNLIEISGKAINPSIFDQGTVNDTAKQEIDNQISAQFSNAKVLMISGGLIVLIFVIIVVLMKKNRR